MCAYVPPYKRNSSNQTEKKVSFENNNGKNDDDYHPYGNKRWNQSSHQQRWNQSSHQHYQQRYQSSRQHLMTDESESFDIQMKIHELETKNRKLEYSNELLKKENDELKSQNVFKNEQLEIYKGKHGDVVAKSELDDANNLILKLKSDNHELERELKNINDVHEQNTASLKTEINILNEEIKSKDKEIHNLKSSINALHKELSERIEELTNQQIEESTNQQQANEGNQVLIDKDKEIIKNSLEFILNNPKIKKEFFKKMTFEAAEMKLTLSIIEKL